MDPSIWFYSFSTAAQVLAALAGLFAVFVVYKIQESAGVYTEFREIIAREVSHISHNMNGYTRITLPDAISLSDKLLIQHYSALLEISETEPNRLGFISPQLNTHNRDLFRALVSEKTKILTDLRIVLTSSLLVIAACLYALVGKEFIGGFSNEYLAVSFSCFTGCLYLVGGSIYRIASVS